MGRYIEFQSAGHKVTVIEDDHTADNKSSLIFLEDESLIVYAGLDLFKAFKARVHRYSAREGMDLLIKANELTNSELQAYKKELELVLKY